MENNIYKPESKENGMKWSSTNSTVKMIFRCKIKIIGVCFTKKKNTIYFNVSLLIKCVTCHFFVIVCEIY